MLYRIYYWPGSGNVPSGTEEHKNLLQPLNEKSLVVDASDPVEAGHIAAHRSACASSDGVAVRLYEAP